MKSLGTELSDDDKTLPYLHWTPKLHKSPVKHRFIAGSSKCTTKQLSSLLTKILTVIKTGLEKYCSIKTSHTGVNNMWILKIPQIYCHLQVSWESIEQLLFKHSIFLPCTLDDDKTLPYLHWTPKLHKSPVKHRFIAGSSKCTTKQLSSLLTKILTVIKTGLEKYCSIKTSHTGVNNMWILKNSTNLLSSSSQLGVHRATSIQTFHFSTLYTSIPHDLLKSHINNIINNAFKYKNGATQYTHIKVGRNKSYFTSYPLNGDNKYTANDICKMIEFLVDHLYVRFGG